MSNSYCTFSTADDKYAIYAAISLLTVRRFNKDLPLYLLGSWFSEKTKAALRSMNIRYIEVDLSGEFTETWEYPLECYYIFAGPELLYKEGFTHSIYMDGDILCRKDPLDNDFKDNIISFAGVSAGNINLIFGEDLKIIQKIWEPKTTSKPRVNSGVVYFNNAAMHKAQMLAKTGELFRRCLEYNIPRKGDDSLFALFQLIHQPNNKPQIIKNPYNYIPQYNNDVLEKHSRDELKDSMIFFHFGGDGMFKPWTKEAYQHSINTYAAYDIFTDEWRQVARKCLGRTGFKTYIAPAKTSFIKKLLRLSSNS